MTEVGYQPPGVAILRDTFTQACSSKRAEDGTGGQDDAYRYRVIVPPALVHTPSELLQIRARVMGQRIGQLGNRPVKRWCAGCLSDQHLQGYGMRSAGKARAEQRTQYLYASLGF